MINWSEYTKFNCCSTWFPEEIMKKYLKGKILDIGCGIGNHLSRIDYSEERFGIDISELAIKMASKKCPDCNFMNGSIYNMPYGDNFFDSAYSIDVIEHLKQPHKMLCEAKRVLRPGGFLIIQTPNYPIKRLYDFINWINPQKKWRKNWQDDPTHVSKFSYLNLKRTLNKHFIIIEINPRNILLENKITLIKKIKDTPLGRMICQKIIIVCQKPINT